MRTRTSLILGFVLLALAAAAPRATAQEERVYGSAQRSQAQREADALVSLSPERIIETLRTEPGLLLQVKKRLARLAYSEGRLIEPAELTDEALYRLIREDANIRVLATREIESRLYIRPRPTADELEVMRRQRLLEEWEWALYGLESPSARQQRLQQTSQPGGQPSSTSRPGRNQEEDFWSKQEPDTQTPRISKGRMGPPSSTPLTPRREEL